MSQPSDPPAFRPPLPRAYARRAEVFALPRGAFVDVATRAAATLVEPGAGTPWVVDGATSDALYLIRPCPCPDPRCPPLTVSYDLLFGAASTHLSLWSANRSDLARFVRFVAAIQAELLEAE